MDISNLRHYIASAVSALSERKEEVNRLNVFPVPDGDTGTNMSLTVESVAREVAALPADADAAALRKAVTHGSLMGARGNSGVITSQILRGLCEGLEGAQDATPEVIDKAMKRSVEVAFQAVRKPVKGTILPLVGRRLLDTKM
jgi:dihydroxyacetone kinase-like predicted kinase